MKPRALILHAHGSNRDHEAAQAFELAGAQADIVPLNTLRANRSSFAGYQMLCLPGGFSYADALGAGKLHALDLTVYFADEVKQFVEAGKPVIGICNGFQALVKSGILPNQQASFSNTESTLSFNQSGHFECRWVTLTSQSQTCVWTRDMAEPIYCPIAHGEGNFIPFSQSLISSLQSQDQIALTYSQPNGSPASGAYPYNPNGSVSDIAGICNPQGNVLGLMPHPENHIYSYQHPRFTRGEAGQIGLKLFQNGVQYASQLS